MNLEEIIISLNWEPYEKQEKEEVQHAYYMYKRYFKFLEIAITKKIVQMKLMYPTNARKFLEHVYHPDLLPIIHPNFASAEIMNYETVTFDLVKLMNMITPVIRKHMEQHCYPGRMHRIIIGPELNQVITRGKLPDTQHEFGVEPYFKIVYCPDITGISVLP